MKSRIHQNVINEVELAFCQIICIMASEYGVFLYCCFVVWKVINLFYASCLIKDIRLKLSEYSWCEEEYEDARWRPLLPPTPTRPHPPLALSLSLPPGSKSIQRSVHWPTAQGNIRKHSIRTERLKALTTDAWSAIARSRGRPEPRSMKTKSCSHETFVDETNEVIVDLSTRTFVSQHNNFQTYY